MGTDLGEKQRGFEESGLGFGESGIGSGWVPACCYQDLVCESYRGSKILLGGVLALVQG